jgi:hypothetical protein
MNDKLEVKIAERGESAAAAISWSVGSQKASGPLLCRGNNGEPGAALREDLGFGNGG